MFCLTDAEFVVVDATDWHFYISLYDSNDVDTSPGNQTSAAQAEALLEIPDNQQLSNESPPWIYNQHQDAEIGI